MTVKAEKKRAVMHLEFCVELYREQMKHGRCFLHEHPAYATSWQEDAVKNLRSMPVRVHGRGRLASQENDDVHD